MSVYMDKEAYDPNCPEEIREMLKEKYMLEQRIRQAEHTMEYSEGSYFNPVGRTLRELQDEMTHLLWRLNPALEKWKQEQGE